MNNEEAIGRAAAALALELPNRMAGHAPGRQGFQRDYGQGRRTPDLGATRLSGGGSWHSDGDRSPVGENRLDRSRSVPGQTLWGKVKSSLCPGTMFFVVCLAITTFIVVV